MALKRIGQRAARQMQKRLEYLESLNRVTTHTPGRRRKVTSVTLDEAQLEAVQMAETFGAKLRWERFGSEFTLFAYRDDEAPAK